MFFCLSLRNDCVMSGKTNLAQKYGRRVCFRLFPSISWKMTAFPSISLEESLFFFKGIDIEMSQKDTNFDKVQGLLISTEIGRNKSLCLPQLFHRNERFIFLPFSINL